MTEHLAPFGQQLAADDFDMCRRGMERLIATLARTDSPVEIVGNIDDVRRRLLDQFKSTFCLLLSSRERRLFEPTEPPFGKSVEANFHSANEDIYEACKCLALERSTACVMHLMRVSEAGLAALAGTLGVTKKNDWGAYLREIDKELEARAKASGARTDDEQFYAEAAASFDHLRRAWRNPTMHVDRSYSPERATEIFEAVKSFMRHLSARLKE